MDSCPLHPVDCRCDMCALRLSIRISGEAFNAAILRATAAFKALGHALEGTAELELVDDFPMRRDNDPADIDALLDSMNIRHTS